MGLISQYADMTLANAMAKSGYDPGSLGELQLTINILKAIPWMPTTHGDKNVQYQSSRLASGSFVTYNDAIPNGNGLGEPIEEPVKCYELESRIDSRFFKGRTGEEMRKLRDGQDAENTEGAMQGFGAAVFNGSDASDPKALKSFAQRRGTLNGTTVVGGSGTGSDVASVYTVEVGKKGFYFGYPEGAAPGLRTTDMGLQRVTTANGDLYMWCRMIEVWAALILRDERALIRYANLETSGSSNIFDPSAYLAIKNRLPSRGQNAIAFANRDILTQIDQAAYNKANAAYSMKDIENFGTVSAVGGVPFILEESLTSTETAIT